jgi:2-oxoisovalerate dehydrogenase E1 component
VRPTPCPGTGAWASSSRCPGTPSSAAPSATPSASHATALTGINAARYAARAGQPTPILFVCEDNRIGISVHTPSGWIRDRFGTMRYMTYFDASGSIDQVWDQLREAVRTCRVSRTPVFVRLDTVRLWGHAGSDVERSYRTWEEITRIEEDDPLLANARRLLETGAATPSDPRALVADARARVRAAAEEAPCRSSSPASSKTRWSCASGGWPTRRASAATSTTTTRSADCATFRGS